MRTPGAIEACPQPTYFTPDQLTGLHTLASGVRATEIGEDGDLMLIGHHDDEAALTALVEFGAWNNGETLLLTDLPLYDVERSYASFSDHNPDCELVCCTCDEDACEPCRDHRHDTCDAGPDNEFCLCLAEFDHDVPTDRPFKTDCGCECWCDDHSWWAFTTRVGHEVTWVRYSHARARALVETAEPSVKAAGA